MGPCHCPHSAPSGPLPASSPYTRLPGCLSALSCPLCPRASAPAVPFAQKLCSQCLMGSPCRGHSISWSSVTTLLHQLLPTQSPRHLLLMGTVIHGQSHSAKWSSSWAPCRPCMVVITGAGPSSAQNSHLGGVLVGSGPAWPRKQPVGSPQPWGYCQASSLGLAAISRVTMRWHPCVTEAALPLLLPDWGPGAFERPWCTSPGQRAPSWDRPCLQEQNPAQTPPHTASSRRGSLVGWSLGLGALGAGGQEGGPPH